MKQVKLRSMLLAALVAVLAAGILLFCVRYVVRGGQWAAFSANDHAYRNGRLALGQVLDRNGLVLYDGASGTWAEDGAIRRATLHAVGDRDDNISTSAKAAMRRRLVGFDPLTGTSAGGHAGGDESGSGDDDKLLHHDVKTSVCSGFEMRVCVFPRPADRFAERASEKQARR